MNAKYAYRAALAAVLILVASGCSTVPETSQDRTALNHDSLSAYNSMRSKDPTLATFLSNAYGYVIFPSITKGAAGIGGAYGNGEVFEQGTRIGYADITQYTIGLALGGETYSEMIIFEDKNALDIFKAGRFTFAANCSAVAVNAGVGSTLKYQNGVVAVVQTREGFMGEASIGGQSFSYKSLADADASATQP